MSDWLVFETAGSKVTNHKSQITNCLLAFGRELVADAADSLQEARRVGPIFEVLAQADDEVVDRAGVGLLVKSPDVLEKRPTGDRLAAMRDEISQQRALHTRQQREHSASADFHCGEVQSPAGKCVGVGGYGEAAAGLCFVPETTAQQAVDARDQDGKLERLRKVVVGASFKPAKHVLGTAARSEHQNRH